MTNVNVVCLAGRLVRDPELRATSNGKSIASACLCVNESVKDGNGWTEKGNFIDLRLFGTQAETLCKYGGKGSLLFVTGKLSQDKYTSKDGKQVTRIVVVVNQFNFGEKAENTGTSYSGGYDAGMPNVVVPPPSGEAKGNSTSDVDDDDLPF